MLDPRPYTLTTLAATGDTFAGFAPYVPSIDDDGAVAFQARLRTGRSAVFIARNGSTTSLSDPGAPDVLSHPDINRRGDCCFYGADGSGMQSLYLRAGARQTALAPGAGPLGPTMNEAGAIAFRATNAQGRSGIFLAERAAITTLAETGPEFAAFHGLPVINSRGTVVFRADLTSGRQAIISTDGKSQATLIATGDRSSALGSFPSMNDAGAVAFAAELRAGGSGVFLAANGGVRPVIDAGAPFESFRGALVDGAGRVVFFATPRGGTLGIFCGPDPHADRVLGLGASFLGSTVADFALNPVSINERGRLAVRVALADGRQLILRADPSP